MIIKDIIIVIVVDHIVTVMKDDMEIVLMLQEQGVDFNYTCICIWYVFSTNWLLDNAHFCIWNKIMIVF